METFDKRNLDGQLGLMGTTLLALIQCGLSTPYNLMREAALSLGVTSPGLRRLEEDGFIVGQTGNRNKTEYQLTRKGEESLRESLLEGRRTLWDAARSLSGRAVVDMLPRVFFLLWIYFGSEAVSEAAQLARKKIEHRAEGLRHNVHQRSLEIDELLVDLFRFEGIADNPSAIGKSYLLLKEKADLVWLDHQSSVIPEIVSSLPAQLEGIGRNFVTKRTEDSSTER